MGLKQTQALLARVFTDARTRRAFFEAPRRVALDFGLAPHEAEVLVGLDRREVEDFARSLLGKRALDARKVLPLTAMVLGPDFDRLLLEAIEGPPSPGRHRADAAALTRLLSSGEREPAWIGDLARYEMAFVRASRPGAVLELRRFSYPVDEIARRILSGAHPDAQRKTRVGLWLRAPRGRLFCRIF